MLFTLFFYWKILFTNRLMFPWDAAEFFYPYFHFVHEELRHLRLPFWDPYVMSGFPIIGDMEAQIFYPINWLFVLLNPFAPLPYKLVEGQLILHFFLAGLFMYYLAREFVSTATPALLSGILFMASGAMIAHTQHLASINSMAWYPLIFLLARRGLFDHNYFFTASAGMLFGIQILAGHWQHSVYLGLFLFLYFLYEACFGPFRRTLWPRWLVQLVVIAGLGAALAMVQIIPSYELGNLSVRSYLTDLDVTAGNEPRFLWTLFLPNYFGGLNGVFQWYPYDLSFNYVFLTVPGCLLALLGLVETIRRRNFFWLGAILLFIELSIGWNGHLASILARTPLLNLFRNAPTFFDLANFGLCLMAAVGAEALFSRELPQRFRKYLTAGLGILLFSATLLGLTWQLPWWTPGWSPMLGALALVSLILSAMLRNRISPGVSQWAILGVMVFELCYYNMNQTINATRENPQTYLTRDLAIHRSEMVQFLRSDTANDFRVAAIAEYPWSGNGWNVWRIPGIYGWNPITLRRYERYIRTFTQTSDHTLPYGGPDHNIDSPLLDLLGTKYLLLGDPVLEEKLKLRESPRFDRAFFLANWWALYRNKDYLPHGWFYPRATVVPNEDVALAVMNSRWFDARRTLVVEKDDLRGEGTSLAEELPTIFLRPEDVAAASNGRALVDPLCRAHPILFGDYWGARGSWFQYNVTGLTQPGRYLLLMQYTAGQLPTPSLRVEVKNENNTQSQDPVPLQVTYDWVCHKARTVELGEVELGPGTNQITVRSEEDSVVNIYSLWLVRIPPAAPPEPVTFSFDNFSAAANQISFDVRVDRDGFLLLNEIHYPGWEATLDGKPVELLRADTIFRSLYVPSGSHRIGMRFRPRYFAWGAAGSLLTLGSFLGVLIVRRRRRSQRTRPS
ncbi:MAG: hypothetical protein A3H28_12900 [Acidobacteria bacterium RIFCSPLOWO2_02_FULL_61_28]|nr:MAG: hypothetical protein A3H28_12900 [Acidobacteria bacterium RIFCSPLOWO2_02_FULL_61_28]